MKTLKAFIRIFGMLVVFLSFSFSLLGQTVTWDAGGDGVHWDDPMNWSGDVEPTAMNFVVLPSGSSVIIRMTGEVADGVNINSNSSLTIEQGADLTSNNNSNGVLTTGSFINHGTYTGSNNSSDGIRINTNGTVTNYGSMIINNNIDEGICLISSSSRLHNYGSISIDGGGVSNEGLELTSNSEFYNYAGAMFSIEGSDLEVIDCNGDIFNDGTMTLIANSGNSDAYEFNSGDTLVNNGTIDIIGTLGSGELLDAGGILINNGIINITGTANSGTAFRSSQEVNNNSCGIINIGNGIYNNSGTVNNDGTITSAFTGTNDNSGTFNNNGNIHTTTGTFDVTPNAILGPGTVSMGPVPLTTQSPGCTALTVPALGEWGLLLLLLIIICFGLVGIYNTQQQNVLSTTNGMIKTPSQLQFPFDTKTYFKALKVSLSFVPIGFVFIWAAWGEIIVDDFIGMAMVIPMVAYLIYLIKEIDKS